MKKGLVQGLALSSLTLGMLACSGGGGGGGGSSAGVATGALSVPNLNCGSSACLSSSASLMTTAVNSSEEISAYGELVYDHFNSTSLPKLNQMLYQLETAFKSEGLTTCAEIEAVPAGNEQLNSTTNVVITAAGMTSPFSGSTTKTFELVQSGDVTAIVSIGCSGTVRHMYVKAEGDSGKLYEVWVKTDSANSAIKSVEAAADSGSAKLTIQFQATTATAFSIAAAGANYPNPYGGSPINFAIYGGANLGVTPKKAHIAFTESTSSAAPTSWSANNANWTSATPIRHCYSNFETGTVDASGSACSGVTGSSPTVSRVRGNTGSITWRVDDLDTAIVAPN